MKKVLIILAILLVAAIAVACGMPQKNRVLSAKIRYFDGSMDTILINSYYVTGAIMTLQTVEGRKVVIGANNVVVIEETEEQYNCVQ